ncbi:hypothetical protein OCU04_003752 [Sclerotinia nivalis]|uniref:Cytochrome P450 n=1 Tax=Sclerotinia nivalis TaxID=352851 RepID=A0A9X0ASK2_9HELO|nr:hypothetical protein OCU04_003752 [Sclerotinia nivalis]
MHGLVTLIEVVCLLFCIYRLFRIPYLLFFHPLAKFPGPTIAAFSNVWYAYHWLSGRYPWAIEDALLKYGDVVRIAPNELVFLTPQAFHDIYLPQNKKLEVFEKTNFQNRGKDLGGIVFEEDPVKHRETARKLSLAFSNQSLRAMEPVIRKHMDYFVERMKELSDTDEGVEIVQWTDWLAMDSSTDLTWNEEANQMKNQKSSVHLEALLAFNSFATVIMVYKRFPFLHALQYLFIPVMKLPVYIAMTKATSEAIMRRMSRTGNTPHLDYFDSILPAGTPIPKPVRTYAYSALFFLLEEPECCEILAKEIRSRFEKYEDISPEALNELPYLHAVLEESLRMLPQNNTGLPRLSPGAMVDGHYVPKGTHIQTSIFTLSRSPRYFHNLQKFRPERWLPSSHPLHDSKYDKDALSSLHFFSLGPRACLGREMAWMQEKLFVAKVVWMFDLVRVEEHAGHKWKMAQTGKRDLKGLEMLEKRLLHYGFLVKPEIRARFVARR